MLYEYRLESVLGAGAFGITYLARDSHLDKQVAIKEYLPTELAVRALDGSVVPVTTDHGYSYQWGLDCFIQEARTLARFSHPNIVRVSRCFEANGTGYMVMDYEQGASLARLLREDPPPDEPRLRALLLPLLDGLDAVHAAGFLHHDIKPANVFVRGNGVPVLLDFGAARQALGGATKSPTSVLTPGYASREQYSSDTPKGPWSDIYALAGVAYRALLGEDPPDAVSRRRQDAVPGKLAALRGRVSDAFIGAVEWGLALDETQRPRSVSEWKRAILGEVPVAVVVADVPASGTFPRPLLPDAPGHEARSKRSAWRWLAGALALAVALAWLAGWPERQPEKAARTPGAVGSGQRPVEGGREGKRLAPTPAESSPVPRERPPRERTERPGKDDTPK
jgi:serine/threonine protein kinase